MLKFTSARLERQQSRAGSARVQGGDGVAREPPLRRRHQGKVRSWAGASTGPFDGLRTRSARAGSSSGSGRAGSMAGVSPPRWIPASPRFLLAQECRNDGGRRQGKWRSGAGASTGSARTDSLAGVSPPLGSGLRRNDGDWAAPLASWSGASVASPSPRPSP